VVSGSDTDDESLLAGLRAGDERAFEALVRTHAARLLSVARRFLRSEDDAQDAVQDAFLSAFKAIDTFQGGARVSTWLHRIVVNASLMKLRSRRRKPEEPIDDLLPQFIEDGHHLRRPTGWQERADVLVERREVRERVRECMDRLPESYRLVMILRDVEDLDTAETARLLGIEEGAVKTRLHRARQALRALLEPSLRRGTP
jgi:RNA polymerase sigma-70 factor (ECF subfamily)